MNTSVRNLTVGGRSIPLDPPRPPEKPHMLLWIDTETTGISRTDAKILEIGMIVTSLDAAEEGGRFISPVRPDDVSLYDLDPYVLRMHLDNHRKLDLSTYRISDLALDHNPYQGHTGTHRVEDCITRDRNDYTTYLDRLIEHERNQQ